MKKRTGLGNKGLGWLEDRTTQNTIEPQEAKNSTEQQVNFEQALEEVMPTVPAEAAPLEVAPAQQSKPKRQKQEPASSSSALPGGYTRATFIIKKEHMARLKAMSYVKDVPIKDLVDQALSKLLKEDVCTMLQAAIKRTNEMGETF